MLYDTLYQNDITLAGKPIIDARTRGKYKNSIMWRHINKKIFEIAFGVMTIDNLPNPVTQAFIVYNLICIGAVGFYKTEDRGVVACQISWTNTLNPYYMPTHLDIVYGEVSKRVPIEDVEIVYNNSLGSPMIIDINYHTQLIYDAMCTMRSNLKACKSFALLVANNKTKLSMKDLESAMDNDEFFLHIYDDLELESIQALDLKVQAIFLDAKTLVDSLWNDCYTDFGVNNNPNQSKKERLSTVEVDVNNEITSLSALMRLDSWRKGFKRVNERFDTDITVEMTVKTSVANEGGGDYTDDNDM